MKNYELLVIFIVLIASEVSMASSGMRCEDLFRRSTSRFDAAIQKAQLSIGEDPDSVAQKIARVEAQGNLEEAGEILPEIVRRLDFVYQRLMKFRLSSHEDLIWRTPHLIPPIHSERTQANFEWVLAHLGHGPNSPHFAADHSSQARDSLYRDFKDEQPIDRVIETYLINIGRIPNEHQHREWKVTESSVQERRHLRAQWKSDPANASFFGTKLGLANDLQMGSVSRIHMDSSERNFELAFLSKAMDIEVKAAVSARKREFYDRDWYQRELERIRAHFAIIFGYVPDHHSVSQVFKDAFARGEYWTLPAVYNPKLGPSPDYTGEW